MPRQQKNQAGVAFTPWERRKLAGAMHTAMLGWSGCDSQPKLPSQGAGITGSECRGQASAAEQMRKTTGCKTTDWKRLIARLSAGTTETGLGRHRGFRAPAGDDGDCL